MHDDEPVEGDLSEDEFQGLVGGIFSSDYYKYVRPLAGLVKGKTVAKTSAGSSGFVLTFTDGSWAASYLVDDQLGYAVGTGDIPPETLARLSSAAQGDGRNPLSVDLPYADEVCDMEEEIANCVGQEVVGLAYGDDCFNFRFPKGRELETMIVPAGDGKWALRVFWEQW